jgi:hypothetical protein
MAVGFLGSIHSRARRSPLFRNQGPSCRWEQECCPYCSGFEDGYLGPVSEQGLETLALADEQAGFTVEDMTVATVKAFRLNPVTFKIDSWDL